MALIQDGTHIDTLRFNDTILQKVIYNNVTVFEKHKITIRVKKSAFYSITSPSVDRPLTVYIKHCNSDGTFSYTSQNISLINNTNNDITYDFYVYPNDIFKLSFNALFTNAKNDNSGVSYPSRCIGNGSVNQDCDDEDYSYVSGTIIYKQSFKPSAITSTNLLIDSQAITKDFDIPIRYSRQQTISSSDDGNSSRISESVYILLHADYITFSKDSASAISWKKETTY